jgi:hypothetical protein
MASYSCEPPLCLVSECCFYKKALPVVSLSHVPLPDSSTSLLTVFCTFNSLYLYCSRYVRSRRTSLTSRSLFIKPRIARCSLNPSSSPSPQQSLQCSNQCNLRTVRRAVTRMATNGSTACSTAFLHSTFVSYLCLRLLLITSAKLPTFHQVSLRSLTELSKVF